MTLIIRRATKADIPALIRLNTAQTDYHAKLDPSLKTGKQLKPRMKAFFLKHLPRVKGRTFVAVENKRVIGFAMCEIQKTSPATRMKEIGYMRTIFVDQKSRRSGAGNMLMTAATDWLKEKGMTRIELGAVSNNKIGLNFWYKQGFKERMKRLWKKI